MTKTEAFEFLDRMAKGIATMFGDQCETLVHEIQGQKIVNVVVYNGHVSGRTPGSTLSIYGNDTSLDEESLGNLNLEQDYVNQMVVTPSGKTMKSSTFHLRGEDYHYALGINYDITVLGQMNHVMENLLRTEETLRASLIGNGASGLDEIFETCLEVVNRPLEQMQKTDRIALVELLKEKGFFQMQKSVPYAAERLGVTKYTIYNYLNELGGI
jgi:predicted transcriptional regulator YheO